MGEAEQAAGTLETRTLKEFGDLLRSTDAHAGGAAAAAGAASLAAATVALVATLNGRRRKNARYKTEIEADTGLLHELQRRLLVAGDEDERALDQLMRLYTARPQGESSALQAALQAAAETSIEIARLAGEVCAIAERQIPHASRFTVSDLGAGAALARGAVTAALLTADVNVALLRELGAFDEASTGRLEATIVEIDAASDQKAQAAVGETRRRIAQPESESAS